MKKETEVAVIELLDNGIVSITYGEEVSVTKRAAEAILKVIEELQPDPGPRVVFYNPQVSFEFEAIQTLSSSPLVNAVAIVDDRGEGSEMILKPIEKLFRVAKFQVPIKYFNSGETAVEWLLPYVK